MTEKDITRIAEATAKIVIDHIEAKQDEWNNEFDINPISNTGLFNISICSKGFGVTR